MFRIPRRPWDKSLLNMNARLMQGASLEIIRNINKIATGLPKNLKTYKRFEDLELGGDLSAAS